MTAQTTKTFGLILLVLTQLVLCSCAPIRSYPAPSGAEPNEADLIGELLDAVEEQEQSAQPLERMGYTIQVGVFAQLDNAVQLERLLDSRGLEAYYFRHESGLYKVGFGNFKDDGTARKLAQQLRTEGVIDSFYIVEPQTYATSRPQNSKSGNLREELVRTARRFLGTPYRWGGSDREEGFDCSGLTMTCYRLNGLNLPRISQNQFQSGKKVSRADLRLGDLVFFATNGGRKVSHVGIYIGDNRFIHAPRTGQPVQVESLDHVYYSKVFLGGRSYL